MYFPFLLSSGCTFPKRSWRLNKARHFFEFEFFSAYFALQLSLCRPERCLLKIFSGVLDSFLMNEAKKVIECLLMENLVYLQGGQSDLEKTFSYFAWFFVVGDSNCPNCFPSPACFFHHNSRCASELWSCLNLLPALKKHCRRFHDCCLCPRIGKRDRNFVTALSQLEKFSPSYLMQFGPCCIWRWIAKVFSCKILDPFTEGFLSWAPRMISSLGADWETLLPCYGSFVKH